ncbi:hypothetical protein HKD37_09G025553 [Glycine soja]
MNLGINSAIFAELVDVMKTIEFAYEKGWENMWLECNSMLVEAFLNDRRLVQIRNRWEKCIVFTNNVNLFYFHTSTFKIPRDGVLGTQCRQGSMIVTNYSMKFDELSKYFPYYNGEGEEHSKCIKFVNDLLSRSNRPLRH